MPRMSAAVAAAKIVELTVRGEGAQTAIVLLD